MKKFLVLLILLNFSNVFSQCTISGADEVQVGERQVFTAEMSGDSSNNSYEWIYLDEKAIPEGDLSQNSLTVKGSVPGSSVLYLEINGGKDKIKCQKIINVISPISGIYPGEPNCDIKVEAFKERKLSNNLVVFEPQTTINRYSYKWIVSYRSGLRETSMERNGQFKYSNQNIIDHVELQIKEGNCSKRIMKPYDTNFWYFF
jgi:hypothetical protein